MSGSTDSIITLSSYPRAIAHIDCDAFFASCEQAREPRLKKRPVATGKERGIVSCASYEAKGAGVERGMRLFEAKRVCPELIILPSDYETYSIYSERMFEIIRRFSPSVEEFSIDEAYCDLTGLRRIYRTSYPLIAKKIKSEIEKELDIIVSVGLSITKTLAKICSKHGKPNGFIALPGYSLHEFLKDIPAGKVCGFGPNTVELLGKCGIKTVLDYISRPADFAGKLLGKIGLELWHELRGKAVYGLCQAPKNKYLSISKTKTFMPASNNKDVVKGQLMRNLESACIKLRRHHLSAALITAYLRRSDFRECGLKVKLNRHTSSTLDFVGICAELFDDIFDPACSYRATGVIISDIVAEGVDSRTLFDDPLKIKEVSRITKAVDEINEKFGKHTVHIAASNIAGMKSSHSRNDIAERKRELLKGETFRRRLKIPMLNLK
jgi:Nucleotidyltransferase/DNA polymerase involved in DNA repair